MCQTMPPRLRAFRAVRILRRASLTAMNCLYRVILRTERPPSTSNATKFRMMSRRLPGFEEPEEKDVLRGWGSTELLPEFLHA